MASSSITIKGQVTIPSALREKFRLEPGDKVLFLEKDGGITLMPMKQDITRLVPLSANPHTISHLQWSAFVSPLKRLGHFLVEEVHELMKAYLKIFC